MAEGGSIKAAFISNAIITVIKSAAAFFTNSPSMVAESIHSAADMFNQSLLWMGIKRSKKEANDDHPFGFGKEQYFWSFLVAIILFALGAGWSVYEGVHKLLHPEPLQYVYLNLAILGISVLLEGRAWMVARKELGSPCASEMYDEVVDCKDAGTVVVLVEDTGALVGLAVALLGNVLAWQTGIVAFDAVSSVVIGVLLGFMSYFLANEMRKSLIGEAMDPASITYIRRLLNAHPDVKTVGEIKTMQMGSDSGFIGIEVDFRDDLSDGELDEIIPLIEERIQKEIPDAEYIFIEPADLDEEENESN